MLNLTETGFGQIFSKKNLTTQQIDEMYSGQPFSISNFFFIKCIFDKNIEAALTT